MSLSDEIEANDFGILSHDVEFIVVDKIKQAVKELKDIIKFLEEDPYTGFDGQITDCIFIEIDKIFGDELTK